MVYTGEIKKRVKGFGKKIRSMKETTSKNLGFDGGGGGVLVKTAMDLRFP